MNQFPKRKNIRLKNYDYSQNVLYFITICTKDRECILSKIIATSISNNANNGSVKTDPYNIKLTNYGTIAKNELLNIPNHFKNVKITDYIIMPNHIHFIVQINVGAGLDQPANIPNIIGLYKSGVTRKINVNNNLKYSIWQRNYYEHIIRNEKEYLKIAQYIRYNPLKWKEDKLYK